MFAVWAVLGLTGPNGVRLVGVYADPDEAQAAADKHGGKVVRTRIGETADSTVACAPGPRQTWLATEVTKGWGYVQVYVGAFDCEDSARASLGRDAWWTDVTHAPTGQLESVYSFLPHEFVSPDD